MKCKICKGNTTWDESYGLHEFIVCPNCFDVMLFNKFSGDLVKTMIYINEKGEKIRKKNKKKGK